MPASLLRKALLVVLACSIAIGPLAPAGAAEMPYFRFKAGANGGEQAGFTASANIPSPGRVNTPFFGYLAASEPASFAEMPDSQAIPGIALASDGSLVGRPTVAGTFRVAYLATAARGATQRIGPLDVTVVDVGGAVEPKAFAILPAGQVGVAYPGMVRSSNVESPVYALTGGGVPGVTIKPDGGYTGTPTQAGSFPVSFRVSEGSGGPSASVSSVVIVAPAPADPSKAVTATASLPGTGTVGVPYSGRVDAANAAAPSYVVASGGIPGVAIHPDGTYSGVPTQAGSFAVSLGVVSDGKTVSAQSVTVAIAPAQPAAYQAKATLPRGQVGTAYAGKVEATPGSTFALASGGIPGVSLAADGSYAGTPTQAGSFPVSFTATSPSGETDTTAPQTVEVTPPGQALPLTVTATIPPNAQMNRRLVGGLTSTGAAQPTYAYADGSDRIPGILVAGDQVVGVPSQVGEYDVSFKVTAPDGRTATSAPAHVRVDSLGALTITDANAPYVGRAGDVWEDYTYRLSYDDRQFMYPGVFSVVSGALPDGLSLDEYGNFLGSPTRAGDFPIRYQVRMPDGRTAMTDEKTIVIRPAENTELGVYATLPERLAVGQKFSEWDPYRVMLDDAAKNYAGDDGTMPFATTVSGALPDGVTLDGNGVFGGTPSKPGTYAVTYTARLRDGSREGVSRTYTYVVDDTAFRVDPDKTRATALVYPGDETYQWQYVSYGLNILGGQGPFTLSTEVVTGPALNHADPVNPAIKSYDERQWEFFYTQREVNERTFRICATGSDGRKACTMDLYMRWGADRPFTWTVAMDNPSPSCANGEVPYSYIVSVNPTWDTYTLNSVLTIDGRQGEDASRRRVESLGGGRYRISAVMTQIGNSPRAYDILSVTNGEGVKLYPETDDTTPIFYPQFGSCDREAMIGGAMVAGWAGGQTVYDAKDFATTGAIVQSYVSNAYGGVVLLEQPTRMQGSCYVFEHEIADANGDRPPWQLDRNVFLSDNSCKGGPEVGEVTFSFMDSLGRVATTPTLYLGGW